MYLKAIVFILFLYELGIQMQEDKEICVRNDLTKTRSDITDSFRNIKNTITSFFKVALTKLEKRRQKIKKAFYRFIDEAFYDKKPKCLLRFSSNEDVESKMSTPELIVYHGYQAETHIALTSDGYMLSIHRILPTYSTGEAPKVVILNHGLLGSSVDWILLGPKKALPYLLSEAGYDVWLPNCRGNKYSRGHVTKVTDAADFWNFSWHEIGLFDISAVIDYIRKATGGKSEINFIAYSMSGSALLVLLSSSLKYNAILKSAVLLAPLVYMENVKGPLQYLTELYVQYSQHNSILTTESEGEFPVEGLLDKQSIQTFCKGDDHSCSNPLLLLSDGGKQVLNMSIRAKIYNNVPAGGSIKTVIHYLQLIKSGQFQMFDLGEYKNNEKYGSTSPPSYQLKDVKVSLILFHSIGDSLSTPTDISNLILHIPALIKKYVIKSAEFSHLDFLWADKAPQLVYLPLIKELQKL